MHNIGGWLICGELKRRCCRKEGNIFSYLYIITQRRQSRMELTYHWEGDYLIPDISLGDGSSYNIGKYGRMRQKYLCENYPSEYLHLVITEKLWKQLEDLEEECHEMLDRLMEQMAKREGLTEHMKSTDQLGWIRKMNSIQSRAEEIVIRELIYTN